MTTFPKPTPKVKRRPRPITPRSEKAGAYRDEIAEIRPLVVARASGLCEMCGAEAGTVIHHKLRRSQGGKNTLENLVLLSDACHGHIHDNPTWSYENGWLLR